MRRVFGEAGERNLVGAPEPFGLQPVDLLRTGPAFRASQHDHRPFRPALCSLCPAARRLLDRTYAVQRIIQHDSHPLMHRCRIIALDEQRLVAIADEQRAQLFLRDAGQNGGIGDLVTVEVEDRQHGTVKRRVEELVGVPGGRQRPGFRLAVADDAGHDKVRIVEGRAIGMRERVAKLAAFMDRAGHIGSRMAWDAARKRELPEELLHSGLIQLDIRIDLAVGALEIGVCNHRRSPMAGTADIDDICIALSDCAVEMRIDEAEPRRGSPMAEQPRLDMLQSKRLAKQRIVEQIDLPDRQVIGGTPVGIDVVQLLCGQAIGAGMFGHFRLLRWFQTDAR